MKNIDAARGYLLALHKAVIDEERDDGQDELTEGSSPDRGGAISVSTHFSGYRSPEEGR